MYNAEMLNDFNGRAYWSKIMHVFTEDELTEWVEEARRAGVTQLRVRKGDKLERVYNSDSTSAIRVGSDGMAVETKSSVGEVSTVLFEDGIELPIREALVMLAKGERPADKVCNAMVGRRGRMVAGFAKLSGCNTGVLLSANGQSLARIYW